jgi:hypothetical protein
VIPAIPFGFHLAANNLPTSDYSRARDPYGAPVNYNWACAGDFSHRYNPTLMAYHQNILNRLTAGDASLAMIAEFIGKPWSNRPTLYWFRGDGLQNYSGSGHDHWSHISWWRSRSDRYAPLWKAAPPPPSQTGDDKVIILVQVAGKPAIFASQDAMSMRWLAPAGLANIQAQGASGVLNVWQKGQKIVVEPNRTALLEKWGLLVGNVPPDTAW